MTPMRSRSCQESSFLPTFSSSSAVRSGLPSRTTMSGRSTLPALQLTYMRCVAPSRAGAWYETPMCACIL